MDNSKPKICKFVEHGIIRDLTSEEAKYLCKEGLIFHCKDEHHNLFHLDIGEKVFHLSPKANIQMILDELQKMRAVKK